MLTAKRLVALFALAAAVALAALHRPEPAARLKSMRARLEPRAASEEIRVEPLELLDLMYNPQARLRILDLRDEGEFNLFHIAGARRTTLEALGRGDLGGVGREDTVVLVCNGEGRSREGWMLLAAAGLERIFILKGGVNGWLREFGGHRPLADARPACSFDDCRRYRFDAARGGSHPESDPGPDALRGRTFTRKVRVEAAKKRASGSCG